jgi:hypothetical protein
MSILRDAQLRRVAKYVTGAARPPELGAIRLLLTTMADTTRRIGTSVLLQRLREQLADWPNARWLTTEAPTALERLTVQYRNPAAHVEVLRRQDYDACFQLVAAEDGTLWNIVAATSR